MLDLQRQDPYWGQFVKKLDKMWDDQITPTERVLKIIEDATGNQTNLASSTSTSHVPQPTRAFIHHAPHYDPLITGITWTRTSMSTYEIARTANDTKRLTE